VVNLLVGRDGETSRNTRPERQPLERGENTYEYPRQVQ
jgi:hypothetical protein